MRSHRIQMSDASWLKPPFGFEHNHFARRSNKKRVSRFDQSSRASDCHAGNVVRAAADFVEMVVKHLGKLFLPTCQIAL
jgi:hypothetical protein